MMKNTHEVNGIVFEEACGDVFADLGLSNADERMAKATLARAIRNRIKERGLSQADAATLLGTDQGKVSEIVRGRLSSYTYDRLLRFLNILGLNVRIEVEASSGTEERGQTLARIG